MHTIIVSHLEVHFLLKALCFLLPSPITTGLHERLKRLKPESESPLEADMLGVAAELHAESDAVMEMDTEPHAESEVELHTKPDAELHAESDAEPHTGSDAAMDMDAKSLATAEADKSPNIDQGATLHHSTKAACHWNGLPLPAQPQWKAGHYLPTLVLHLTLPFHVCNPFMILFYSPKESGAALQNDHGLEAILAFKAESICHSSEPALTLNELFTAKIAHLKYAPKSRTFTEWISIGKKPGQLAAAGSMVSTYLSLLLDLD
ncbi:hypothetical protein F5141DRAFT_1224731 [Pisolithus sp. B1]|nr:hypothetical protein F5141DRAFT_1224731 [Pisolithus sp. B1]